MTEQFLALGPQVGVGAFQHVVAALHQVAAHVQAARGGDVAGLLQVVDEQAGQQAQAEGVVAVGFAGSFDLGAAPARALEPELGQGVGGLHLGQCFFVATA